MILDGLRATTSSTQHTLTTASCSRSSRHATGPALQKRSPAPTSTKTASLHRAMALSDWTGHFTAPADGNYYVIVHDGRAADHHTVYVDGQRLANVPISPNELYYIPFPHAMKQGESVQIRLDYLPNDTQVYPGLGMLNENAILSDRARASLRTQRPY